MRKSYRVIREVAQGQDGNQGEELIWIGTFPDREEADVYIERDKKRCGVHPGWLRYRILEEIYDEVNDLIRGQDAIEYLMTNMTWYSEDGYEADEDEKLSAIKDLINGMPTVDAVPVDKAISVIQEMIECIDEDFPLLDFNSRYMMERGMRMALIQIKKIRKDGISND